MEEPSFAVPLSRQAQQHAGLTSAPSSGAVMRTLMTVAGLRENVVCQLDDTSRPLWEIKRFGGLILVMC